MGFWKQLWFSKTAAYQYGVFRILLVAGAILPNSSIFMRLSSLPPELSDPPILIRLFHLPFPPHPDWIQNLISVHSILIWLAIFGIFTRVTMLGLIAVEFYLASYANSFDIFYHNVSVPDLALLVLAFAPGISTISIDQLIAWARSSSEQPLTSHVRDSLKQALPRWPAVLILTLLSLNYVSAGGAKLLYNSSWASGRILKFYLDGPEGTFFTAPAGDLRSYRNEDIPLESFTYDLRQHTWIGHKLASSELLMKAFSVGVLLFEISFPIVLVCKKSRKWYFSLGILFHISIFLVMRLNFISYVVCYFLFVNWSEATRLLGAKKFSGPSRSQDS
jgi:hypothetical protein